MESATGIDIDQDGDVGLAADEASRARQLLASEATCQAALGCQRWVRATHQVAGHELPTIMLLYLNGETPLTTLTLPTLSYTLCTPLHPRIFLTHLIFSHTPLLPVTPRCTPCTGKTFLGEAGAKLGKELLAAKRAGFPILMLHENDPAKHGCEFNVFFDGRTPSELMQACRPEWDVLGVGGVALCICV